MIRALEALVAAVRGKLIDARRHPRQAKAFQSAALVIEGREQRVRLINLSESGAMIATRSPLPLGSRVRLRVLDREPVGGQVRWSRDGRAGISFDPPRGEASEYRDEE